MSLDVPAILNAIESHALAAGLFERVNRHEPKSSPGNGLTCAIWADAIGPAVGSGLQSTSARVVFNVRIYASMLQEPQDSIDPEMLEATNVLFRAYSGDFSLGDNVRCVDLLGMAGAALSAQAGYINVDKLMMRTITITLPVIVDNAWDQVR